MPRPPTLAADALNPLQRIASAALQDAGSLSPAALGALLHQHLGKHNSDKRCAYCPVDGWQIAKELEQLGLAQRERKRAFRATP